MSGQHLNIIPSKLGLYKNFSEIILASTEKDWKTVCDIKTGPTEKFL